MKKLFKFIIGYSPKMIILAMLLGMAGGAASTGMIALTHKALSGHAHEDLNLLIFFAIAFFGNPILGFSSTYLMGNLIQGAVYDLRLRLCDQILQAPLATLEKAGSHRLLVALTTDVATISGSISSLPSFCTNVTMLIGCYGYLTYLYWQGTIAVTITAIVSFFSYRYISKKGIFYAEQARNERETLFSRFEMITNGTKELKMHRPRRKAFRSELLETTSSDLKKYNILGLVWFFLAGTVSGNSYFLLIALMVFGVPHWDPSVTPEVISGYVYVIMFMSGPINGLIGFIPALTATAISYRKVEDLGLSLDKDATHRDVEIPPTATWNEIEMKDVTYTYMVEREDKPFTMGPLNVKFKPGEVIMVVGGNGSGKTTFAKLLLGLYQPESGHILFDSKKVGDGGRDNYRQLFSATFTDFYLFTSMLGIEDRELEGKANRYLEYLLLDHKVRYQDGELTSLALSQGQRKRLALLTAYLEDRPFYIFDEWASDQDPMFKDIFYNTLLPELRAKGKTVFAISHDDHYFHCADRIIKLDYGQIEIDRMLTDEEKGRRNVDPWGRLKTNPGGDEPQPVFPSQPPK